MGGRLDSTAVAGGEIAVVTSIGLEHTEVLGPTESAILKEKMAVAGDTRESAAGKHFILGGLSESLLQEARDYAAKLGCDCIVPAIRSDIILPNLGHHYIENASLSLAAAAQFINCAHLAGATRVQFDDALAVKTLATCSWAGRMQTLANAHGNVRVILDGAHNSHAVRRLVQSLREYYPGKKFHCLFGALKDKDVGEMLKLMAPYVSHWHITKTPYPRFRELSDLCGEMQALGLPVSSEGELSREYLEQVLRDACADIPLLITGSLYMIGECVQLLKDDFAELSFFRGLEPSTNEHR